MTKHLFRIRLALFLWQQKLIECPVDPGQFLQPLVADEIYGIESRVQNLQPAQIAVVVEEVSQEPCRHLGPLRPAATRDFGYRRIQTVRRQLAMLLNHALHAVALGAVDQGILQLLRIDARSILTQQRHHVIRGDHVFHNALVFQQPYPVRQALLLGHAFLGVFRSSCTYQLAGILGHVHPRVERFRTRFFAILRAQKA